MGCHDQRWPHRLRRFSPLLIAPTATVGGRPAGRVYLKRPGPCPGDAETVAVSKTLT